MTRAGAEKEPSLRRQSKTALRALAVASPSRRAASWYRLQRAFEARLRLKVLLHLEHQEVRVGESPPHFLVVTSPLLPMEIFQAFELRSEPVKAVQEALRNASDRFAEGDPR